MKLLDIPLHMQGIRSAYCVPYSLVGVAEYYGIKVSKQKMIKITKTSKKSGAYVFDYTKGVEEIGLKFKRFKFNYKNVRKSLRQGIPIAVSYMSGRNESHFSVIIGAYRDSRGISFYVLNDTYYGRYEIPGAVLDLLMFKDGSYPRFNRSWARKVVKL